MADPLVTTDDPERLKEGPMPLNLQENGYLLAMLLERLRTKPPDPVIDGIWRKLRAHAVSLGVVWYYGDPPLEGKERPPDGR